MSEPLILPFYPQVGNTLRMRRMPSILVESSRNLVAEDSRNPEANREKRKLASSLGPFPLDSCQSLDQAIFS